MELNFQTHRCHPSQRVISRDDGLLNVPRTFRMERQMFPGRGELVGVWPGSPGVGQGADENSDGLSELTLSLDSCVNFLRLL